MHPQLQAILHTIFTRLEALEKAIEQIKKEQNNAT